LGSAIKSDKQQDLPKNVRHLTMKENASLGQSTSPSDIADLLDLASAESVEITGQLALRVCRPQNEAGVHITERTAS
jgi:hypothetical protein